VTGKPHFLGTRLRAFYRSTLLHDVVREGKISCVKWLLEKGADPKIKNHEGETPVTIAQNSGYVAIAKLLESTEDCDEGMSEERGKCWHRTKPKSRIGNTPANLLKKETIIRFFVS
jgi:ankyrin repeat protein